MKIDHVGIAVASIEEALPFYEKGLGLEVTHSETVASQKVKVAFLQAGSASIELLEPMGEEGAIFKFLKTHGPGLHHVAFYVENIASQIAHLNAAGLPPLEPSARPGARGHRVCFLHPKYASGVLVELVG